MTVLRISFALSKYGSQIKLVSMNAANLNATRFTIMASVRRLSSLEVTKNISLISGDKKDFKIVDMKMEKPVDRPLVIMLSWLMARRKHVYKYADIYINKGFDVLNINVTPWQLLWPTKGTQVVASSVIKFLDLNRCYNPYLVHGFSVGGYVWAEVLVQICAERDKYQHIFDKIVGQVWDSTADITEMSEGTPVAVFPRNKVLQNTLKQYILYHLKTFDKVATCHYIRASQMFHTNPVKAPALFFLSRSDPIGAESSNMRARESWENMGIDVTWKCWDKSPHVGHFRHHPEDYKTELVKFIDKIAVNSERLQQVQQLQQVQAKL